MRRQISLIFSSKLVLTMPRNTNPVRGFFAFFGFPCFAVSPQVFDVDMGRFPKSIYSKHLGSTYGRSTASISSPPISAVVRTNVLPFSWRILTYFGKPSGSPESRRWALSMAL